jgi:hypothetical protein
MAAQYRGGLADNQQCRVIILADLDCFYGTLSPHSQYWQNHHAVPAAAVKQGRVLNCKARMDVDAPSEPVDNASNTLFSIMQPKLSRSAAASQGTCLLRSSNGGPLPLYVQLGAKGSLTETIYIVLWDHA